MMIFPEVVDRSGGLRRSSTSLVRRTGTCVGARDVLEDVVEVRRTLDGLSDGREAGRRLSAWFTDQGDRVLVEVGAAVADSPQTALSALTILWDVVAGAEVDERFCTALRRHGAELAARVPASPELAGLFRVSAAVAIRRRTFEVAEVEAMRELTVRGALADPAGEAVVLARLSRIFRAQGRLRRVMDMSDELVALRQRTRDRPGVAQGLRMVGQVLIEAGRPESAVRHLERARTVQEETPGVEPRQVAGVRVLVGLARWLTGSRTIARREFKAAAGLLADAGDAAAAAVEALLAVPSRGDVAAEVGDLLWLGAEDMHQCDDDLYKQAAAGADPTP